MAFLNPFQLMIGVYVLSVRQSVFRELSSWVMKGVLVPSACVARVSRLVPTLLPIGTPATSPTISAYMHVNLNGRDLRIFGPLQMLKTAKNTPKLVFQMQWLLFVFFFLFYFQKQLSKRLVPLRRRPWYRIGLINPKTCINYSDLTYLAKQLLSFCFFDVFSVANVLLFQI